VKMPSVVDLDAVTVDFFLYGSGRSRVLEYCWCEGSVHRDHWTLTLVVSSM
jgi:hypothetical protein